MFSRVTNLCWWKTDHNETTNEDISLYDASKGIFVVADGVSTLFFSRRWAEMIAQHFLNVPLTGDDPFEVEWWLRPLQEQFKQQSLDVNTLHWSVRQKGKEGSGSTLASVRVTHINDSLDKPVTAELLAFGDSCIFIGNQEAQEVRVSFPVENVLDFERAPIAIPSLFARFNRKFHHCLIKRNVPLQAGDILILATDAVAKWILGKGMNTRESVWAAFMEVAQKTPSDWTTFISRCRQVRQMVDDDSTALIIRLSKEPQEDALMLGATPGHSETVLRQRVQQFHNAIEHKDKEAIAIFYGDGKDIDAADNPLSQKDIEQAREVADALAEVWQALRSSLNSSQPSQRVQDIWSKKAYLLTEEPCAAKLKEALQANGIALNNTISSAITMPIHPIAPNRPESGNAVPAQPDSPVEAHVPLVAHPPLLALSETDKQGVSTMPNFTEEESLRHHRLRRSNSLSLFRSTLHSKPLAEQLLHIYEETKEDIASEITAEERDQVELARKYCAAFAANDPSLIALAYIAAYFSFPSSFFFTQAEQQRREAALRPYPLRPLSGVAIVAEQTINYEHFRKMHITYCLYRFYGSKTTKESALQDEMEKLKAQFNDHMLLAQTLDFLVQDQQIQIGIKDVKRTGRDLRSFEHDQKTTANGDLATFRENTDRNYEKLLKSYHLSKANMEELFRAFAQCQTFSKYLPSWGMSPLNEWLTTRQKRAIYPEWAAMQEASSNTDPRRSWIFKWGRWESIPGGDR